MNEGMVPIDSAAIADAAKPDHYREAAASLRSLTAIMPPTSSYGDAYYRGIEYAAGLLERVARDLEEERIA